MNRVLSSLYRVPPLFLAVKIRRVTLQSGNGI
jgi:hypothetical protein